MVDVTEIFVHWYAGRPKAEVARSLGVDVKTVRKYVAAAEAAGLAPGGPAVGEQEWRARAREWFPELAGISSGRTSWPEIARHHDRIGELLGVVPASVIWQRLRDEEGLTVSVASLRRYVRAQFPEHARAGEVEVWRPPLPPGAEAQVDYGYLGTWLDPRSGRRRRVWAFSMVLRYSRYLFVRPVIRMDQRAWTESHVQAFGFFGGVPARVVSEYVPRNIFRNEDFENAAEKRPRRLAPGDHRRQVLAEGQVDIAVAAVHRGEDQRVRHPAALGLRIIQQAHPPEISLAFGSWLAVGHPHRRRPAVPAMPEHLQRVPMQRPLRHHHALPGQQLPGLNHGHALIEQTLQPGLMRSQQRPAIPVPVSATRPDPLSHPAEQLIAELSLTPRPVQAAPASRL